MTPSRHDRPRHLSCLFLLTAVILSTSSPCHLFVSPLLCMCLCIAFHCEYLSPYTTCMCLYARLSIGMFPPIVLIETDPHHTQHCSKDPFQTNQNAHTFMTTCKQCKHKHTFILYTEVNTISTTQHNDEFFSPNCTVILQCSNITLCNILYTYILVNILITTDIWQLYFITLLLLKCCYYLFKNVY